MKIGLVQDDATVRLEFEYADGDEAGAAFATLFAQLKAGEIRFTVEGGPPVLESIQ